MALTHAQTEEIAREAARFLEKRRPAEHIRPQLDYGYRVEGQSVIIYSIRPRWDNPSQIVEEPIAKTTYVQTKGHWKVFWLRADLKWYAYDPKPHVRTIGLFFNLVHEDRHFCFFG